MTNWQKGDLVHRACIMEFEGRMVPVVIVGVIATINPQRDGTKTYHVRSPHWDGGGSLTTYGHLAGELYADPVLAMQVAAATVEQERAKAQPTTEAAHG